MTTPVAEIWWDSTNECAWQLKMLCEPAVQPGIRIPLGWMNDSFHDRFPLTPSEVFADDNLMAVNAEAGLSLDLIMKIVRATEMLHGIK